MTTNAHCKSTDREWALDRKFEPKLRYGDDINPTSIEVGNYDDDWTYLACEDNRPCRNCDCIAPHIDSIIIAVDGACRANGTPDAQAAVGVFVGKTSRYNRSILLSEPHMTNQIAELRAGIVALTQAMEVLRTDALGEDPLRTVVVKADSAYLVKGMTEWVFKWETNGYKSANRKPVKNSGLFQELVRLVSNLNASGVEVLFWQVPREMNKEADALANKAFQIG